MATFITILSVLLIVAGIFFFLGAAVGLLRFPDFYARMHAAGKGDTLSSLLVILGFAVYQLHDFDNFSEDWLTLLLILKLLAVVLFIFLTSPTATSALMDAGWEDDVKPVISEGRSNHLEDDCGKNA
ncbi:MAG: monovalent cation/H(+) antiporter subunit G [Verrucomicrobiales bacterium]|jgi:multicomponent Na+:H+ antiporter subunit G|nr:monovalent cation/H(+) antiporter subunit G [Verrucomicrobiales bacterium]